jgi:phosphoribosylaminoimidazole-succinocarboxamide synthase
MSASPKLLHRGSVKDIYELSPNELIFRFSDRYSIFDWGQMPDQIAGKGAALAEMGHRLLTALQSQGIRTHYLGRGEGSEDLRVKAVRIPHEVNEGKSMTGARNVLIPLEVIYRLGVPKGSSLLKRFSHFHEWQEFDEVKLDFTTKLEASDRELSESEAQALAGMSDSEWADLKKFTIDIARKTQAIFNEAGLKLWDGKFEFAYDENRKLMLVDSIGLDEIRLTFDRKTLSKELLRQSYVQSDWYRALVQAKAHDSKNFKHYCIDTLKQEPRPLPVATLKAIRKLYETVAQLVSNPNESEKAALHASLRESLAHFEVKS